MFSGGKEGCTGNEWVKLVKLISKSSVIMDVFPMASYTSFYQRYTNADLEISLYIQTYIKIVP